MLRSACLLNSLQLRSRLRFAARFTASHPPPPLTMEPIGEHTPKDYVHVSTPDSNPAEDPDLSADPATIFPEDRAAPDDAEGGGTQAPEQYVERGARSGELPYLARSFTEELAAPAVAAGGSSEAPEEYLERGFGSGELSGDLADAVVRLECESSAEGGICSVYIVGTAHVSQDSCRQVQEVIRCLKLELVFLELCPSRVNILTPQNLKAYEGTDMYAAFPIIKWRLFPVVSRDSNH